MTSPLSVMAGSESLTVLPYSVMFTQSAAKTINAWLVKLEHPERELGLFWHIDRPMRPAVRRFQKFLEAEFAGLAQRIDERVRENVWRR